MSEQVDWLKPENRLRATPLDLLKQGVSTQNWEAVAVAYLMLTGEKLKVGNQDAVEFINPNTQEPVSTKENWNI
jgi:hypothetical protein